MQAIPPLQLNEQTASPLLKLLLAQRDLEPPELSPEGAWDVFKVFASIPCRGTTGGVSFQATWRLEDPTESSEIPFLYCTLMREVRTDPVVAGRAVMIQWAVEADSSMEEVEIWSDHFDDADGFFAAVEASPQFQALVERNGTADVYEVFLED